MVEFLKLVHPELIERITSIGRYSVMNIWKLCCPCWIFALNRMKSNIVGMEANMEQLLDKVLYQ